MDLWAYIYARGLLRVNNGWLGLFNDVQRNGDGPL